MKKKSKAPIVISICAVVLIAAAVIFIVTKGFQSGRTDPDKARFERELEEKYGEEFVCLDFDRSSIFDMPMTMRSVCAPVRDTTLTFTAEINIDLNGTQNFDDYPYALASRQLSAELTEKLSGIWDEFSVVCGFMIIDEDENAETVQRIREGAFDWRYYMEQHSGSGIGTVCTVLVDNSAAKLSYVEEWDALQNLLEEYNEEFNKMDNDTGLSLSLYFAPSELYAECVVKIKAPLSLNPDDDYYLELFEEKLDEPLYIGAGYGLTSNMIAACKEPYVEYRKDPGKGGGSVIEW